MVFNSHIFVFYFLPLVLAVYYVLPRQGKNLFLTIASYAFYGWFKPWYVSLMFISTIVNYVCGNQIARPGATRRRRILFLVISIVVNLGLLGFFKYYMFTAENLNRILSLFGHQGFSVMRILLPIGISFYTFQAMSYTIDVYRRVAQPVKSFFDFSCFVALFPQLIAGPIVRYNTLAEQLHTRTHTLDRFGRGILLFMVGFAKKVLLANPCGIVADAVFEAQAPGMIAAWYGIIAYSFQIYFDFCGYSDMAVGLGRMFGFDFPKNFNGPYLSKSITEFWRRWHISLSTWLRDYLYIPLGGNRKGGRRTFINLTLVMLLGGLWHGAGWQFILWGAFHGLLLGFERTFGKKTVYNRLPGIFQMAVTYGLVLCAWVLFRAEDLSLAMRYLGAMFGVVPGAASTDLLGPKIFTPFHLFMVGLCAVFCFSRLQAMDWVDDRPRLWKAAIVVFLFALALSDMFAQAFNPFLYFQF